MIEYRRGFQVFPQCKIETAATERSNTRLSTPGPHANWPAPRRIPLDTDDQMELETKSVFVRQPVGGKQNKLAFQIGSLSTALRSNATRGTGCGIRRGGVSARFVHETLSRDPSHGCACLDQSENEIDDPAEFTPGRQINTDRWRVLMELFFGVAEKCASSPARWRQTSEKASAS